MRTNLLLAFLLFHSISFSQLIFEVNEPQHLAGVYPSINPSNAWNTPNLLQDGNWFSDTLVLADDGQLGFACSPILNVIENQFVLFRRQSCDIGQALMNVQNAGATAALIIDTIDGRPLPFDDTVYPGVTIPFIIISRGTGDSLFLHLEQNTDCVVSFGDKTGWTTNDLGIYMESSWWSMYGVFPFDELKFTDSTWGTWIYNHGDTDAIDAELTFYYKWKNGATQHYLDTTFTSLFVPAQDSLYFDFVFTIPDSIKYHNDIDTLFYGYALSYNDDDSLDNQVENYILVYWWRPLSFTHDTNLPTEYDYIYNSYDITKQYQRIDLRLYENGSWFVVDYECFVPNQEFSDLLIRVLPADSFLYYWQYPNHFSMNNYTSQGEYWYGGEIDLDIAFIDMNLHYNIDKKYNVIFELFKTSDSLSLYCSTDMFHDMRRKADSTFVFFQSVYTSEYSFLDSRVTPIQVFTAKQCEGPFCYGAVEEINQQIKLFPNPVSNHLFLSAEEQIASLQLVGVNGLAYDLSWLGNGKEFQADLEALASGMYLLHVEFTDGKQITKRLVKN